MFRRRRLDMSYADRVCAAFIALALISLAPLLSASADTSADTDEVEARISPFSGKTVPRFDSLRYNRVNGRQGPSLEYPIKWTYLRAGLPVLIIKETTEWARIRDLDGEEVWLHMRMLKGQPGAILIKDALLKSKREAGSASLALIEAGVIIVPEKSMEGWVYTEIDRFKGWVQADHIWGAAPETP